MNLNDLLPLSTIPPAENHISTDGKWCYGDSESAYRKNGGHPVYREGDIDYRLNSLRYRCAEFDTQADIRMISIGCSYTFGVGLPQDALYHELFAERLRTELKASVVNWNLGSGAVSNNYIARLLHLSVPILRPHVILIFFTHIARREYVTLDNRVLKYHPNLGDVHPIFADIARHFQALSSKYNDQLDFYRDYKSIQALLSGQLWFYSLYRETEFEDISGHFDPSRRAECFQRLDLARDHSHLGPLTHQDICNRYWEKFASLDGVNKLQQVVERSCRDISPHRQDSTFDPCMVSTFK
jgi:hypothetical protein